MSILLVVAIALIDKDNRILIAQRPAHKDMAGRWEFPGGKIDEGETPEAALIREVEEELGINTWESCLAPVCFASHSYPEFHLLMPFFACRKWQGTAHPREGQSLKWVDIQEIKNYDLLEPNKPLIAHLRLWL